MKVVELPLIDIAPVDLTDLYSIQDFAALFPGLLSVQTLRWQMRNKKENGMQGCCLKLGRRIFISKSRYERLFLTKRIGR